MKKEIAIQLPVLDILLAKLLKKIIEVIEGNGRKFYIQACQSGLNSY